MLKYNNKVLKVQDKWLLPGAKPVPLQDWYTLGEWAYDDFTINTNHNYTSYYTIEDTFIRTDFPDLDSGAGKVLVTKTIEIPEERMDDDYLLLEIPLRAWRTSNKAHYITDTYWDNPGGITPEYTVCDSAIGFKLRRASSVNCSVHYVSRTTNDNDCNVTTTALTSMWDDEPYAQYYKAGSWKHHLSANYTGEDVDNISELDDKTRKVRLLYDLKNSYVYVSWGINLPQDISLSDYHIPRQSIDLGTDNHYTIGIAAASSGLISTYNHEWLITGYWADHEDCKIILKSYKGVL